MHYFSLTGHLDFITVPTQSRSKGPFQGLFYLSNINIFYERDSKHKKNTICSRPTTGHFKSNPFVTSQVGSFLHKRLWGHYHL